jgi:epoxyqueuosine reductase QueG
LGSFSLHEGHITEVGCNVRFASVITDTPLEVTPRLHDEPYSKCLFYADGSCGECISKYPGEAISELGHDKHKCYLYGKVVKEEMLNRPLRNLLKPYKITEDGVAKVEYSVGCALCQFGVPCMDNIPVK